jgi:hypothetical protein
MRNSGRYPFTLPVCRSEGCGVLLLLLSLLSLLSPGNLTTEYNPLLFAGFAATREISSYIQMNFVVYMQIRKGETIIWSIWNSF